MPSRTSTRGPWHLWDVADSGRPRDRTRPHRQPEADLEDHASAGLQGPPRTQEGREEPEERRDLRGPRATMIQASGPTSCGSPTSPSIRQQKERSTAASCSTCSRKVVGWAIDRRCESSLVTDARQQGQGSRPERHRETVIHSDHGSQFTSWAFTENVRRLGLVSSMGTVGDCYDNAPDGIVLGIDADRASATANVGRPSSSSPSPWRTTSRTSTTRRGATAH